MTWMSAMLSKQHLYTPAPVIRRQRLPLTCCPTCGRRMGWRACPDCHGTGRICAVVNNLETGRQERWEMECDKCHGTGGDFACGACDE